MSIGRCGTPLDCPRGRDRIVRGSLGSTIGVCGGCSGRDLRFGKVLQDLDVGKRLNCLIYPGNDVWQVARGSKSGNPSTSTKLTSRARFSNEKN